MLTHCFLRFLAVQASFPVAIIKHPNESDLGKKGSFVHYNSDYSSSLWVRNRGRGLRQLVTLIHSQEAERKELMHAFVQFTLSIPIQCGFLLRD